MENIKRMVMLLKPGSPAVIGGGGTLKLQSFKEGVSVYFRSESLREGSYGLYLFLSGGRELKESYVGEIKGREFYSTLYGISIDNIKGAAVISTEENGLYNFVLRSTGPDWNKIIERFRIMSSQKSSRGDPVPRYRQDQSQERAADIKIEDTVENEHSEKTEEVKEPWEPEIIPNESTEKKEETPESDNNKEAEKVSPDESAEKKEGFEETGCESCPFIESQERINPFPDIFPNSEWVKISYPGPSGWWHYLSGKIYKNGSISAMAIGVPGEYGITPPVWLEGFNTYLRTPAGGAKGYWIMFQDAETGEALDMGRSLRGE